MENKNRPLLPFEMGNLLQKTMKVLMDTYIEIANDKSASFEFATPNSRQNFLRDFDFSKLPSVILDDAQKIIGRCMCQHDRVPYLKEQADKDLAQLLTTYNNLMGA